MVVEGMEMEAQLSLSNSEDNRIALLALGRIRGLGYRSVEKAARLCGNPEALMRLKPGELCDTLRAAGVRLSQEAVSQVTDGRKSLLESGFEELVKLRERKVQLIFGDSPEFPERLKTIPSPPLWLFVEGNSSLLRAPLVAAVGTRNPTRMGQFLTDTLCYSLAGTEFATVSGLAQGIDQRVHQCSLHAGVPTIAILGTGTEHTYPSSSSQVRSSIVANGGCVVSEYFPWDGPTKESFVWRNRLQSGIAPVTIPIEWKLKSGTAHTVDFATKQGRIIIGLTLAGRQTDETEALRRNGAEIFDMPVEAGELRSCLSEVALTR